MTKTPPPQPAENTGSIRATPRRRTRDPREVRRRYSRARWASAALGGLAAAVVVEAAVANLSARGLAPAPSLYGLALVPFAVGLGLPWLLVSVLWRWRCRRKGWTPR